MTERSSTGAAEANVRFWRQQAENLERDRTKLSYPLWAAAPVSALAYVFSHNALLVAALGGGLLFAWGLGLYMVTVRRGEYAFALREAQRELELERK